MGSGCTKTEAGDVQQPRTADAVDGEQANGTHSADSKKGILQQFLHLEEVTIKDRISHLNQTMLTLVSDLESSSMCCYLSLVVRLLDQ